MRSVEEWIGKNDDTPIPPRVRLRVFERFGGVCQCGCGLKISTGQAWDADHEIPLCNGGSNRESNLRPLLRAHHKAKTNEDVETKSKLYRVRAAHAGVKRRSSRPIPGSKASGIRKRMNGTVEKRIPDE